MQQQLTTGGMVGKDVLTWLDFTSIEIERLLQQALVLKEQLQEGIPHETLKGKSLGMIFQNASTRTRVSFEVGMTQLGGHSLFLSGKDMQIGRGEPVQDTARVMSRYVDAIMIRANDHEMVKKLAEMSEVPVINALTDEDHPCQALADAMTLKEQFTDLHGLKVVYVGDGNNVAISLMIICAKLGIHFTMAAPVGHTGDEAMWEKAKAVAKETGSIIEHIVDPHEAVQNADVIYTDVWTSMGAEEEQQSRIEIFKTYQVNESLMEAAKPEAKFMHCLPAHRGEEVTEDVLEGEHSIVFDQAENRLHVQKAILQSVIG
ncbi:ornithine carbamoyltransferase [Geomicrobium sediminis]|uniref:Ornithine carbamoyltransferase n=1 Tax=Geomicrobium sediminis TaxID=1347788 RepID=A0ABS2P803_9BACL|nr:ornithine carbamoyltransferase [Geomicrobium sediminis]MBM7631549.1 ornithine carbamoyltransferase [Geomicrobium sediminis]